MNIYEPTECACGQEVVAHDMCGECLDAEREATWDAADDADLSVEDAVFLEDLEARYDYHESLDVDEGDPYGYDTFSDFDDGEFW